jgi:hypothetical protein
VAIDPCPELADGESCDYPTYGECQAGRCVIVPDACQTGHAGDPCHVSGIGDGQCRLVVEDDGDQSLYCELATPCDGLQVGDACVDLFFDVPGECVDWGEGMMGCSPPDTCEGQLEGAACEDPFGAYSGSCVDFDGTLYCTPPTGCEGKQVAEPCQEPLSEFQGTCLSFSGTLYCSGPTGCEDKQAAEPCQEPLSGFQGVCVDSDGTLFCSSPTGCEGKQAAEPCQDPTYQEQGLCVDYEGTLYCSPPTGCEGKLVGEACGEAPIPGLCTDRDGTLRCESSCLGLPDGDACVQGANSGYCADGACIPLSPYGSGIDGLGVDACGNVYATEFTSGLIWRIDPHGQMEQLVRLPSMWIPNVKWGRELGGFSSTTLYVTDRDEGRLFALPVGVPSASAVLERGH